MTTTEAAERLGVSRPRIAQLIADGRLPCVEMPGGAHLVAGADVDRLPELLLPVGRPPTETYKPASKRRRQAA